MTCQFQVSGGLLPPWPARRSEEHEVHPRPDCWGAAQAAEQGVKRLNTVKMATMTATVMKIEENFHSMRPFNTVEIATVKIQIQMSAHPRRWLSSPTVSALMWRRPVLILNKDPSFSWRTSGCRSHVLVHLLKPFRALNVNPSSTLFSDNIQC